MIGHCKCGVLLDETNCSPAALKLSGPCKKCRNEYMKIYTRANKEKTAERRKQNYDRNRSKRLAYRRQYYLKERDSRLEYRRKYSCTVRGRFISLRTNIKREGLPLSDPLWSFNYYAELVRDGVCHYCLGELSPTSHALDRMSNDLPHTCYNVVPCCWFCNSLRSDRFSHEEMMRISLALREIRLERPNARLDR